MNDVIVVCPQERDRRLISAVGLDRRYRIHYVGEDLDRAPEIDPALLLEEADGIPADGVVGTKDRSALVAALVAARRGLPGPSPQAILSCQIKLLARERERVAAPEATPRFDRLVKGRPSPIPLPCFAKPVVGRLSHGARRVDDEADVDALFREPLDYASAYGELAALAGVDPSLTQGFLVEDLLEGREVTYEGYVWQGRVSTIGVTESVKYAGTGSFECFEYPSSLPAERRDELADVAGRVVAALGFDGGFFNIEFFVPEGGSAKIIEMNARIASQFAPLVERVHGRSTYELLFDLACGRDPAWRPTGASGVALSYCLRVFTDHSVVGVPPDESGLEVLVAPGRRLSEQGVNDVSSYRLAIFDEWGETRESARERARSRARSLPFVLEPLG